MEKFTYLAPAKLKSGGSNLLALPRIMPKPEENTLQGIKCNYKLGAPSTIPSSLSYFTAIDEGIATPRFYRSTHQSILHDMGQCVCHGHAPQPIGAVVHPFAEPGPQESPIPISNAKKEELIRCSRCSSYVNPSYAFVDGGTKFKCNLCDTVTIYTRNNINVNESQLPENRLGAYDLLAPASLNGKKFSGQNIVILIDTLANSFQSGLLQQVIASLKATLDFIPDPSHTNIGIITYSHILTFYTISGADKEPSVIYISDVNFPFAPFPRCKLLFNLQTKRAEINAIFEKISNLHEEPKVKATHAAFGSCGGAALKAAVNLIKDEVGKILWFVMDIPTTGIGALKSRANRELWNTDKESSLLNPCESNTFYPELTLECLQNSVAVDIFACVQSDIDLATISQVATQTGGEVNYYPQFSSTEQGEKMHFDLFRNLTRETVYEVAIKARSSIGLSVSKYLGGFGEQTGWAVQLSTMDADKTIGFTLKYDNNLKPDTLAHVQFAVLYSTSAGERRIRIFNHALQVTDKIANVFSGIDSEALINIQTKNAIQHALKTTLRAAKEQLCLTCINTLVYYRNQISSNSNTGQLVIPDTMNCFPLFLLSVIKNPAFAAWEDTDLGQKIASMIELSYCSLSHFIPKIYTRVYSLSQILCSEEKWGAINEEGIINKPKNIPSSFEQLVLGDGFLLVNSDCIYVYITNSTDIEIVQQLLGVNSAIEADEKSIESLPQLETVLNERVRNIVDLLRREKGGAYQQVKVLPEGHKKAKAILANILTEDCRSPKREFTYVQFLSHLHKLILNKSK